MTVIDPAFEIFFGQEMLELLYASKGRKSAAVGRDGIRREKFQSDLKGEVALISKKCLAGQYRFTRYKERLIAKGAGKFPRQISIPTIRDRLALRAVNDYLANKIPSAKSDLPHSYIREITNSMKICGPHHSFVRMDVQEFFPSICHDRLLKKLEDCKVDQRAISIVENAITNCTGEPAKGVKCNSRGVPQGLSISNILSSIYLLDFDREWKAQGNFWRYVDDILVISRSDKSSSIFKKLSTDLMKLDLKAHPLVEGSLKSDIVQISKGIDYLGYNISPDNLSVRKSSYKKMYENIMKVFTTLKYSRDLEKFLVKLNLKITGCIFNKKRKGWIFFFSQTENISQLKRLDLFILDCCSKYAPELDTNKLKKFTRALYEIKYDFNESKYFPRFDEYNDEQKLQFISLMTGRSIVELQAM